MRRGFRLTRSTDFKRVRNAGKAYAHPLVVLFVTPSNTTGTHIGISASKAIGNAVQRNRAKRLLRAAVMELVSGIVPGSDLVLVARAPLSATDSQHARAALASLLHRAGLMTLSHGS